MLKRDLLRLYLVMGSNNCSNEPCDVLEKAIRGGVSFFQFREKGVGALTGNERVTLARNLQKVCKSYHIPFIVNDDVDLAELLDADGIHIGQDDADAVMVRERFRGKIVGISTHNVEEARQAVCVGADYIGVGPMYYTNTKSDIESVRGPIVIKEIREAGITIPIVGIGGITKVRARSVIDAGSDGIAVISAISLSTDPEREARDFFAPCGK